MIAKPHTRNVNKATNQPGKVRQKSSVVVWISVMARLSPSQTR